MAIAHVVNTRQSSSDGENVTTGAIDTTGANLIILTVSISPSSAFTISDNKTNTWTALTASSSSTVKCQLYYAENATVGSGHTFTCDSGSGAFPQIAVAAFSGAATSSVFDQQNGATAASAPISTGSVTPSADNELLITGLSWAGGGVVMAINSSFTITGQAPESGAAWGCALAYLLQGAAAATNPSWSASSGSPSNLATRIGTFKEPGAGGGSTQPPRSMHQFRLRSAA